MDSKELKQTIVFKYLDIIKDKYDCSRLLIDDLDPNNTPEQCYIIKSGSVSLLDEKGNDILLSKGDPIGFAEACLSRPYQLRYALREESIVYRFNCSDIRQEIIGSSSLMRGMIKYSLDRIFDIKKSKTYHLIEDGFLSKQKIKFPMKEYNDGETIFNRLQNPNFFFYIESGNVELISKSGKVIVKLNPGDSFGEMALFTDDERQAKAKSKGNTVLHLVSASFIKEYFDKESPLLKITVISILERLKSMNELKQILI